MRKGELSGEEKTREFIEKREARGLHLILILINVRTTHINIEMFEIKFKG